MRRSATPKSQALLAALAALVTVGCNTMPMRPVAATVDKLTYHGDAARTGWNDAERTLTPAAVASGRFGLLWQSPPLDSAGTVPPRLFATPLYVGNVDVHAPGVPAGRYAVVYAASTTGFAYAVAARGAKGVAPGTILWRRQLVARPCMRGTYGVLGTPVIDERAGRLYVAACDETDLWSAFALDLHTGELVPAWPLKLTGATVNVPGVRRNGENHFPDKMPYLQRSALNLSPDGTLYVATGSSVLNTLAGQGIAGVFPDSLHNWGQSVIQLRDSTREGLTLTGTYTPFNYCQAGSRDMDLGSSTPVLIELSPAESATPHLLALGGGKQGNAYLLDRAHLPGSLEKRPPCSEDASTDGSLLAPEPQPQFGRRGPLNVFGPYTESNGMGDQARSRSTLAWFRRASGEHYLFLTGSAKQSQESAVSVPPGLVRVRIVTGRGVPVFLRLDAAQPDLVFQNPGSPFVTSHGSRDAIVWVLDENKPRSAALYGADAPQPVLYAVDAMTMQLLWKSRPGELGPSGKYNEPTIVDGEVIVGTDRIQAYGLRAR